MRVAAIVLAVLSGLTAACNNANEPETVSLAGTYSGTASGTDTGSPFTQNINLTVQQAGRALTGTWAGEASSGTLTGTVGAATVEFTLAQANPCPGTFTGSATIELDGERLTGSYAGSYCLGTVSASFVVTRTTGGPPPPPPPPPSSGSALTFSGDQWVEVPDAASLDLGATFTLEAWIKPRSVAAGAFQHVLSKWNGGGDASYTLTISTNGHLRSGVHDGTSNTILESTVPLTNGVWQHVAVTFDNGARRLYIDGVLDTTQTGAVTPMNSTRPLSFGHEGPPANIWPYDGLLDEVRVWNVARTGAQIAAAMNTRLTGTESGLVGYWPLDEGAGDVAADASGENHGRLGSAAGTDANDPQWSSDVAPIP